MKKLISVRRIISLVLIVFVMLGFSSACSLFESSQKQDPEGVTREFEAGEVPLTRTPAVSKVIMPVASGTRVESNSKAMIDYSNTADGYVMVKWLAQTSNNLFVQIIDPNEVKYQYTLLKDGTFEVFPLAGGNGPYTVIAVEQTGDGRGARAAGISVNVTLTDEFAPFLRPSQYVNFNENSAVVTKAAELVAGKSSLPDKVAAVYSYVIKNFTYDTEFANTIINGGGSGYVPDLDSVLARRKGICFDYSAVMTAMLRSQGIPTKMVFGYADNVFHAWISVYSKETGWVDQAIFFDGVSWMLMDPTFAAAANSTTALKAFIGDGNKYTVVRHY